MRDAEYVCGVLVNGVCVKGVLVSVTCVMRGARERCVMRGVRERDAEHVCGVLVNGTCVMRGARDAGCS